MDDLRLKVVASGQLVTLTACPVCGALVVDVGLHRVWHAERDRLITAKP